MASLVTRVEEMIFHKAMSVADTVTGIGIHMILSVLI